MMRSKTITIVAVSDNHYLVLLAPLIKSIESSIAPDVRVDMWVVEDSVTENNKKKLQASIDPEITKLYWKKVSEVIPSGTKLPLDQSSWPLNIYMRLFIPYFIPKDVEKVLYLDVDMIVLKDISSLWQTDISNYMVAAVQDPRVKTFDNSWGGVFNYKELGIEGTTKYFNTGLLMLNLKKWRENNITEKILACIEKNKKFANYPDQYGLNIVLANQWLELDPLWNHFATIEEKAPYLIHFVQRKPIYKSYDSVPAYRELFFKYLKLTAWKNAKPIGETKRYFKKIKNVLNKIRQKF